MQLAHTQTFACPAHAHKLTPLRYALSCTVLFLFAIPNLLQAETTATLMKSDDQSQASKKTEIPHQPDPDTRAEPHAIPTDSPERLPPEFTASELEDAKLDIQKRQLVSELLDAIRFYHNRAVPVLIKRLEKVAPESAELYYFKALLQYRAKEKGQAHVLVEKSLRANPGYARAHNLKGLMHTEALQLKPALRSFEKAWRYAPYNPTYAYNIASTQYRLGNMDEAREMVAEALDAKINLSEAYYLQGLLLNQTEDYKQACRSFEQAHTFGQNSPAFYIDFLQTALRANNREAQLLALKPVSRIRQLEAYQAAGETHFRFGEFKRAAYFLGLASFDEKSSASIRQRYVEALGRAGMPAKAVIDKLKIEDAEKEALLVRYEKFKAQAQAEFEARDQILSPLR